MTRSAVAGSAMSPRMLRTSASCEAAMLRDVATSQSQFSVRSQTPHTRQADKPTQVLRPW